MEKIFISKTVNNSVALYIAHSFISEIDNKTWTCIIMSMEPWSVWKTNIGNTHTGWEFTKDFSPEMIQLALKKATGIKAEII